MFSEWWSQPVNGGWASIFVLLALIAGALMGADAGYRRGFDNGYAAGMRLPKGGDKRE